MYPSPTPPSSIKRSRYRFETPQLSRRLAPASIENQATKVAPSGKNLLHETGGSFELNNNDNTGDTFYFRNAMGGGQLSHTHAEQNGRSSKATRPPKSHPAGRTRSTKVGSFVLNNNDNTGDTFYFRNAMGGGQFPHTRRAERKIIESTNQTTKVAPGGKNSLHIRGVHQAEQQ